MWNGTVPLFTVNRPDGTQTGTEVLWQKHEMLIALLHPNCERCAQVAAALKEHEAALRLERVGVVTVTLPGPTGLAETLSPFGIRPGQPTLAIADRYGRLFAAFDVHSVALDRLLQESHEWTEYIQEQCEECGAPLDWAAPSPS